MHKFDCMNQNHAAKRVMETENKSCRLFMQNRIGFARIRVIIRAAVVAYICYCCTNHEPVKNRLFAARILDEIFDKNHLTSIKISV